MITKNEIENIPPQGNINFRERKIEKNHTALLIIDLQKGEYKSTTISLPWYFKQSIAYYTFV